MTKTSYVPDARTSCGCNSIRSPDTSRRATGQRWYNERASYNERAGLLLCCPITTRVKGYPFEVNIAGKRVGVVLADQVKSLDWRARRAESKGRVNADELAVVRGKLKALVG